MSNKKQQVSRRQFLNYTLTGLGGFMAAGILTPMLRMAVDPVLQPSTDSEFTNVGLSVDDITSEPQRVEWQVEQVDGWYESEVTKAAWRSEEHTSELQSRGHLVCRLLLEKKK